MRFFFTVAASLCFSCAFSQNVVDVDKSNGIPSDGFYVVGGAPIANYRYVRLVEGSPYFSDNWMRAVTISSKGARSKPYLMKIDLAANELHFLNERNEEMICTVA